MEHVRWTEQPSVTSPVVVCAFTGWNDAGDAASTAVRHLVDAWSGVQFASIDPEEFYDFQSTRPEVRLNDGQVREVVWPANELYSARTAGGDVVLLLGAEPQLRWRTFCRQVTEVAGQLEARLVLTLGALLADVPHSRPVSMVGTATNQGLIDRFGLARSRYEGPTGIVGVLQEACEGANLPSASLWAAVPAYAAAVPSPKATLALVERTAALIGTPVPVGNLDEAGVQYEQDVEQLVASDDDLVGYVRRMEAMGDDDEEEEPAAEPAKDDADPGTAARFVEDIEQFLRDRGPRVVEMVAACVWRTSDALLLALDDRFGEPVDAYVNGSQVWLREDGPDEAVLEWRLHPVAAFRRPPGIPVEELLQQVVDALRAGTDPPAPAAALWDGLEAFPAYGDEIEPAPLAATCTAMLGMAPDAFGVVDHDRVGDEWERAHGAISIVAALLNQLAS